MPLRSHWIHIKDILHPRYSRKAIEIISSRRGNRSKVNRKEDREENKDTFGVSKLVEALAFGLLWITKDVLGEERYCCILNDKHLSSLL